MAKILRESLIQNVKNGIQDRVFQIKKESAAPFELVYFSKS